MFKEGDFIKLREGAGGRPGVISHGATYEVGGRFYTSTIDPTKYVGVVSADHGGADLWHVGEMEHSGGPW